MPPLGSSLQQSFDHAPAETADLAEVSWKGVLEVADVFEHSHSILVIERRIARHHLKDQHPDCPPAI